MTIAGDRWFAAKVCVGRRAILSSRNLEGVQNTWKALLFAVNSGQTGSKGRGQTETFLLRMLSMVQLLCSFLHFAYWDEVGSALPVPGTARGAVSLCQDVSENGITWVMDGV